MNDAEEIARECLGEVVYPPGGREKQTPAALVPVDLSGTMTHKPAPPRYIVAPWIPRGVVTLLGGHGGFGKTYFALVLAAHVASGTRFAGGMQVEQARVVFASLEDDPEIMRYRLRLVIDEYGLNHFKVLENLTLLDGTGGYAAMMAEATPSLATLTPAYYELAERAQGAGLIVVDNASDAFDANENQRRHVRGFIRGLTTIARDNDAGCVLLAHIDKSAARNGSQGNSYSGSTAWHNSCRSRLAILANDDGSISVEHEKNNLGKKADPMALTFTAHGVPVPEQRKADGAQPDQLDAGDLVRVFKAASEAGINVPANLTPTAHSAYTALESLAEYPARFQKGSRGRQQAARAIVALKRQGVIIEQDYTKPNRHKATRFVLAGGEKCADTLKGQPDQEAVNQ